MTASELFGLCSSILESSVLAYRICLIIKRYLLLVTVFLACTAVSPAQELQSQDAPSARTNLSAIQSAPLNPGQRTALQDAVNAGDYTRAETLLLEEINHHPKSPELLKLIGGIFFLDGKYLNSAIAMKKAEALAPVDDGNRFTLAMAYVRLDQRDWARPELEKLARSDPRNPLYPYWLSRLDYDAMQFTAAIAHARRALKLDPNFMRAYDNLGLCYEALGKQDDAIQYYQQAIRFNRLGELSPWPTLNLGTLLVKLGRLEEAEPYLRESLRYDRNLPQVHYQLGLLLERQKKDAEALEELSRAAVLDASYAEPHYILGRIHQRKGEAKHAQIELRRFQELKKQRARKQLH